MEKSLVLEKSIKFALRIVKLYKYLTEQKKEYVLSKQILISGTYIAKFAKAAIQAEDRSGFLSNMNFAMQRASETEFWLLILHEGEFLETKEYDSINVDCVELIKMLSAIVKTTKTNE
ncbi:MAG: four helix bundle protein [Pyrinomonadaceae bacterium]